ncbi:MAG: REP-associated tyrosine transposase [Desulfomonilaceae bacterium]
MGRSRYRILPDNNTYFATCAVVNRLPIFGRTDLAQIVLDSMKFMHERKRLVLHAYVLMENHLHLVGSSENFSQEMSNLKSFTARSIVDFLTENGPNFFLEQLKFFRKKHKKDQDYQVWQEGFHPQAILNGTLLKDRIEYIHNNPVKRGYVECPEHWRYSSAAQYAGLDGVVPIDILE